MGKEKLLEENRQRVFEIMGIDPNDPHYNCHHIVFRNDFAENPSLDRRQVDDKSNLFPLTVEEHERLHKKIEEREGHIIYQAHRRRRKPKKKEFSGKNPNEE